MEIVVYILTTLLTFMMMEVITWCTQKLAVHGFFGTLHTDHHKPKMHPCF